MPSHHPDQELLLDYAAGGLREPMALLLATHLALCPACRATAAELDVVGGALLDDLPAEPVEDDALDRLLAALDRPAPAPPPRSPARPDPRLPAPLRDYVGGGLDKLDWKSRGGLAEAALLADFPGFRTRLMRIKTGAAMPRHTHQGNELTLVLAGGFTDSAGHYLPGDVATADASVDHQPVADPGEDCLCLAVTDAPLRLTGPIGRFFNVFLRI